MISTYRKEKSLHGHPLDVLKSGLQKYIRRGNVKGAMYCLGELDLFSECEGGERIRTNMIHRLMIIYMEDIGLGGVKSWAKVSELVFGWLKDRTRTGLLQELVCLLCNSKKTRACSFARAYANSMPDEIGKGCLRAKILAKDWACIKILLARVGQNSTLVEYKRVADEMSQSGVKNMNIAMKWIREVKTVERPLFFLLPLLEFLFGGYELEPTEHQEDLNWNEHKALPIWVFDDYVFDKHTRDGQRGRDYFVSVSSQVNKEIFLLPECFADKYYGREKKVKEIEVKTEPFSIPSAEETDYELVVRCQLVCSKTKTDSVIARCPKTKKIVFLKGPFKTDETVRFFLRMQEEKRARNIPAVNARLIHLVPNRWARTPIGIRNELDLSKPWPFMECDVVFNEGDIKTRVHSSSLWPETAVMDCEAMNLTINPFKLKGQQLNDYIKAVRFREEFKIGDLADRNFLLGKDGRIYSVDEETSGGSFDLLKQLKRKRYELVMKDEVEIK